MYAIQEVYNDTNQPMTLVQGAGSNDSGSCDVLSDITSTVGARVGDACACIPSPAGRGGKAGVGLSQCAAVQHVA